MDKAEAKLKIPLLKKYAAAYTKGSPIISDVKYDKLFDAVKDAYPNHSFFKAVGSDAALGDKVLLPLKMGSLSKIRPTDAIDWINNQDKKAELIVTPKLDGLSGELVYVDGTLSKIYTRGDGEIGRDVTDVAKYIQGVLPKIEGAKKDVAGIIFVKCEFIIFNGLFNKHFGKEAGGKYSHPRNFAVGCLNRKDLNAEHIAALKKISAIAFGMCRKVKGKFKYEDHKAAEYNNLSRWGFTTVTNPTRNLSKKNMPPSVTKQGAIKKFNPLHNWFYPNPRELTATQLTSLMKTWGEQYDFLQDGIVIELAQHDLRIDLDFDTLIPGYARAVKLNQEDQISKVGEVAAVRLEATKRNVFIPVWILKTPLDFNGVKVSRISAHNVTQLLKAKAGVGSKISICRSGDVIPFYLKTIKPATVKLPIRCPVCKTRLERNDTHLFCPNKKCTGPAQRTLNHFFNTLKVDGMGPGVVEQMTEAGFTSIPKILTLTTKQLSKIDGFAERKSEKILEGLKSIVEKVALHDLMDASSCFAGLSVSLGSRRLKLIVDVLGKATVLTKPISKDLQFKLEGIKGIGEATAKQFVEQLPEFRMWFNELRNVNLTLANPTKRKVGPLTGKVFCFTGYRDQNQKEFIQSKGGEVIDNVTSRVTVLLCGTPNSTKAQAAKAKGITIVEQSKAQEYLEKLSKTMA